MPRAGTRLFDTAAAVMRRVPPFRGQWQVANVLRRLLLPLRGPSDALATVRMRDGSLMIWDLRDESEGRAAFLGRWDDDIRNAVIRMLPEAAVILDVGASVGAWTIPLARQAGRAATVYAFEPVPANRERLQTVIAANALTNVTVSSLALGEAAQRVGMWLRSSVSGAESGTAAVVPTEEGHIVVEMQTLDRWTDEIGLRRIDFIKLDVEGAELQVLAGGTHTVQRLRPVILAEFDPYWMSVRHRTSADVTEWARRHAYRMMQWNRRAARWEPTSQPCGDSTLLVPETAG
ncbi:MAG: FkbM family methyltransferase [Gemmatimonadaceae bacterium]|nr:FkbM family methyltransferase [Gemmatimonadaceae bacterium]